MYHTARAHDVTAAEANTSHTSTTHDVTVAAASSTRLDITSSILQAMHHDNSLPTNPGCKTKRGSYIAVTPCDSTPRT